jgi:glycogen debranching enzyme
LRYFVTGPVLVEAVLATFRHRETPIATDPIGLTESYYADPARSLQWRAFIRRSRFIEQANDLERLVAEVRRFAIPLLAAAAVKGSLSHWNAGGPWV